MGVYGIFILVLTFIYVVYYIIMICMDLYGSGKSKQASTELIKVEGAESEETDDDDESPTHIEGKEIFGGDEEPVGEEQSQEETQAPTAEEIAAMNTDVMYEESKKAQEKMEDIHPKAQNEFSLTSEKDALFDFYRQQQVEAAANFHNEEDEDE